MSKRSDKSSSQPDVCAARIIDTDAVAAAVGHASNEDVLLRTADIFSALADPTRLRLVEALAHTELCVCDLAEIAGISQSGVSHQLRLLRDRGIVAFRREGQRAVYRIADDHVRVLLEQGLDHARERVGS